MDNIVLFTFNFTHHLIGTDIAPGLGIAKGKLFTHSTSHTYSLVLWGCLSCAGEMDIFLILSTGTVSSEVFLNLSRIFHISACLSKAFGVEKRISTIIWDTHRRCLKKRTKLGYKNKIKNSKYTSEVFEK